MSDLNRLRETQGKRKDATSHATAMQLEQPEATQDRAKNTPSCMVAFPRRCNHATGAPTHATGDATGMQLTPAKALAYKVLRRNRPCNHDATEVEKLCNSEAQNQPQKLHQFRAKNGASVMQPAMQPVCNWSTPAREFLDLAGRKIVTLHTDRRGGLWWTSPPYEDDPASLADIASIWSEAWPDLFRLLEAGDLDPYLVHTARPRPTTGPPARRRKLITPAMMVRFRKSRPWIEAHMPELLGQGWTRRSLYRAGKHPHPFGPWGLAWASAWTSSLLARVVITSEGVAFVLKEPHREVTQTARPK
jgi:hypothetical protein